MLNNSSCPTHRDRACAACKHQRKRCTDACIFAPYFPVRLTKEFNHAQKVFGASNMAKMASKIPMNQRRLFFDSIIFESEERYKNPVFGCTKILSMLRSENEMLRERLRWYENLYSNGSYNGGHNHYISYANAQGDVHGFQGILRSMNIGAQGNSNIG